jgi:hypothetical protein
MALADAMRNAPFGLKAVESVFRLPRYVRGQQLYCPRCSRKFHSYAFSGTE